MEDEYKITKHVSIFIECLIQWTVNVHYLGVNFFRQ